MRTAFMLFLLAGSVFYTFIAFDDLNFLTRTGRLGPGFFPRVIGVAMIIFVLWSLIDTLRGDAVSEDAADGTFAHGEGHGDDGPDGAGGAGGADPGGADPGGADPGGADPGGAWRDVVILVAMALVYAVLLRLLGGFPATVLYLAGALSLLNRGRPVQNAILCVVLPAAIYLLFDRLLNANMPPGLIDLSL